MVEGAAVTVGEEGEEVLAGSVTCGKEILGKRVRRAEMESIERVTLTT